MERESNYLNVNHARQLKVLTFNIEKAHDVLIGKYTTIGETVFDDLRDSFLKAKRAGVDISLLEPDVQLLLKKLPPADLNNHFNMAKQYLTNGDFTHAKLWHAQADARLRTWGQKELLSAEEISEFMKESHDLYAKLY